MARYITIRVPYKVLEEYIESALRSGYNKFISNTDIELTQAQENHLIAEQLDYMTNDLSDLFEDEAE
jgi:hypothetical protein